MMDLYFDDMINMNDMADGDLKYELGFGVEVKDSSDFFSDLDLGGPWIQSHTTLNFDLFACDNPANLMVDPNKVMPLKRPIPSRTKYVEEPEEEEEEDEEEEKEENKVCDTRPFLKIREDNSDEDSDEDEDEEDDTKEEQEEEEGAQAEEEEEEDEKEEEIEEVVKPTIHIQRQEPRPEGFRRTSWSSLVTVPVEKKTVPQPTPVSLIRVRYTDVSKPHITQTGTVTKVNPPTSILAKSRTTVVNNNRYPKPAYPYSCLIAMALKNSSTGSLRVSEIYNFMCEYFPFFETAPLGWKNCVRHNLSMNKKYFEKVEKVSPMNGSCRSGCRKGCLWTMKPDIISKMDNEVAKWSSKDPSAIKRAMRFPDDLEKLERGDLKVDLRRNRIEEEEEEEEEEAESEVESEAEASQLSEQENSEDEDDQVISEDEGEVPPSLKPFDSRLNTATILDANIVNDFGVELSEDMYEELGLLQQVLSTEEEAELFSSSQAKRPRLQCVVSPLHRQPVRPV